MTTATKAAPALSGTRLREITRAAATESGSPNPHVVAARVLDALTPDQRDAALAMCLPDYVRHILSTSPTGPRSTGRSKADRVRTWYASKLACAQCGKKGVPAEVGTPWRDGHKHAGAIRLVMRAILRDLWREARAIHESNDRRAAS